MLSSEKKHLHVEIISVVRRILLSEFDIPLVILSCRNIITVFVNSILAESDRSIKIIST